MADETKLEAFQRLFPPRAAKVLDAIRVASHCMKPHMEADTELTSQFMKDVKKALDPFWTLDSPSLTAPAEPDIEPDTSDDTVTIGKSEFDRLKALELDRAKVAYGLSKIEKTNAGTANQMMQGIALIKEGIGRKVKNDDDS